LRRHLKFTDRSPPMRGSAAKACCAYARRDYILFENLDRHGLPKRYLAFRRSPASVTDALLLCLDTFRYRIELEFVRQIDDDETSVSPPAPDTISVTKERSI